MSITGIAFQSWKCKLWVISFSCDIQGECFFAHQLRFGKTFEEYHSTSSQHRCKIHHNFCECSFGSNVRTNHHGRFFPNVMDFSSTGINFGKSTGNSTRLSRSQHDFPAPGQTSIPNLSHSSTTFFWWSFESLYMISTVMSICVTQDNLVRFQVVIMLNCWWKLLFLHLLPEPL